MRNVDTLQHLKSHPVGNAMPLGLCSTVIQSSVTCAAEDNGLDDREDTVH